MTRLLLCIAIGLAWAPLASRAADAPKPPATTPKQISADLKKRWGGPALTQFAQRITSAFGKAGLEKGKAKLDETTAAWAVLANDDARVVKADGTEVGRMFRVEGDVQALALELPNFQEFQWHIEAGGKRLGSGVMKIEHFPYTADSLPQAGVPKGRLEKFEWRSKVFTNTVRDVTVYIPAQYNGTAPACLMVWQDGSRHADPNGQMRVPVVFDNLIAKTEMPLTIGVFIDPGRRPNQTPKDKAANRGFEYDTPSDLYVRFLLEEILPEVTKRYSLKLRADAAARAIGGGSSGGICSFTAAWERPGQFGKVLTWVGSFVDLRGGHVYPYLIRKTERKPIRVYLLDGDNDLDNPFGNWPLANRMMASSLAYMAYDHKLDWTGCFHGSKGMSAYLPDALRWLWRDVR